VALTSLDFDSARWARVPTVTRTSSLPPNEQRFVERVMDAARALPPRATLYFDWDLTLANARRELREGARDLIEQLRDERPDLDLGVLTSRREHDMDEVRGKARLLGIRADNILQHEHMDAINPKPDLGEIAKLAQIDKSEAKALLSSVRSPNKLAFLADRFRGRLASVHLVDDGDSGSIGERLGFATRVDAPECSVRVSALL
jgi:hypothetical protein